MLLKIVIYILKIRYNNIVLYIKYYTEFKSVNKIIKSVVFFNIYISKTINKLLVLNLCYTICFHNLFLVLI